MDPQSVCDFNLSYSLNISDADNSPIMMTTTDGTSAMVPVDGSDNYTVTIFASNRCGAGPAISTGNMHVHINILSHFKSNKFTMHS